MSGGIGFAAIPSWIERGLAVLEAIEDFRLKWTNRMSRETDEVSAESVAVIKGLMEHAKQEYRRGHAQGMEDMRQRARVIFPDSHSQYDAARHSNYHSGV